MATLIVLGLPAPGKRHTIQNHRHVILGRDTTCDLMLSRQSISRFHAQVTCIQGNYFVEDLQSTNGTFLNGRRIQKRESLRNGDRITLHDVPIAFYLNDVDESAVTMRNLPDDMNTRITDYDMNAAPSHSGIGLLRGRIKTLIQIARDLGSSLQLDEILPRVLDLLFRMFPQAMVGEIHMRDSNGQLRPVAMKHGRDADATDLTGVPFDVDLLEEVMESGQGVLRQSEAGDPGLAMDDFHESTICAPMLGAEAGPAGVILLQADGSSDGFNEDDLELVSAIGVLAGQSVGYARSHDIVVEHTNTRRQLETARQIQLGMLPRERPNVPGYEFWHHYAAAERVGGDYFFYEMLRDGRVMFGIADASGKGLSAALNIARFAGEVRFRIATSPTLKSAISSLNGFVIDSSEECMFITACICVLDPHQHLLSLANAGHPAALLKHRGKERVELLQSSRRSFPLGISREFETHPVNVALEPGDEVLLYTDGVSEAMNPLQKLFGTDRLSESFARPHQSIAEVVDGLVQDVMHFREDRLPSDDMTLIALARL